MSIRTLRVYARATLAVLLPAYKRRWDRQREEARRAERDSLAAYQDSLPPAPRTDWWHKRNAASE